MALYNLSSFLQTIKEDIGIKDLPLPVTDKQLIDRFDRSVLNDFSQIYPRVATCCIGDDDLIDKEHARQTTSYVAYRIPKWVYDGTTIIGISHFDIRKPNGYSDLFIPQAGWTSPEQIIAAVADVRMAAGLATALTKSPTIDFVQPNIIKVYNGWSYGIYEAEILLKHDLSLATIPNDAFIQLRELATLDMEEYLYNQLKRKENLDLGVGNIQLHIDDWSNAANDKKDLLRSWNEGGANLDFEHPVYF